MLSERDQWLLTAYVDGELSLRQNRQVEQLLHRSTTAREFLQRLQQDAMNLRQLPRHPMPMDVSGKVLQTIKKLSLKPRRYPVGRPVSGVRVLAIAAGILVSLSLGSYWYFHSFGLNKPEPILAHNNGQTNQNSGQKAPEPSRPQHNPLGGDPEKGVAQGPKNSSPTSPQPANSTANDPVVVEGPRVPPLEVDPEVTLGSPRENAGPVLTDRGLELFEIKKAVFTPLVIKSIHELEREAARINLKQDLGKAGAFRLELPVVDANRTLERLEGVCKSIGISLQVDATARARQGNKNWKSAYVIYSETLSADELIKLLHALGSTDKPGPDKKKPDVLMDRFVLASLNKTDRKELADLLGVDLLSMTPPHSSGLLGTDLQKPIQEQTTNQIIKSMTEQGGKKEPSLLALSFWPVKPNRTSVEIKHFLETRKPIRPGAIQLMIVLRNVG